MRCGSMSAFGTAEQGFATLMLSGIINAACDGGPSHPPGSGDINDALAAVTGIAARDETFAAISALRRDVLDRDLLLTLATIPVTSATA